MLGLQQTTDHRPPRLSGAERVKSGAASPGFQRCRVQLVGGWGGRGWWLLWVETEESERRSCFSSTSSTTMLIC